MNLRLPTRKTVISVLWQSALMLLIFLAARAWLQRDMLAGPVPPFNVTTLSGQAVSSETLQGETHLVYFWADWCPICKLQRPAVSAIAEDWPVLSIAMQSGDEAAVNAFMQQASLDWQTVVDESGQFSRAWGVAAVPALFVVDADGEIRFAERGYTSGWGMQLRLWWASLSS